MKVFIQIFSLKELILTLCAHFYLISSFTFSPSNSVIICGALKVTPTATPAKVLIQLVGGGVEVPR